MLEVTTDRTAKATVFRKEQAAAVCQTVIRVFKSQSINVL